MTEEFDLIDQRVSRTAIKYLLAGYDLELEARRDDGEWSLLATDRATHERWRVVDTCLYDAVCELACQLDRHAKA